MAIQVESLDDFGIIERVAQAIQDSPNFDLEYVLCGFPMAIRPSKVGQLWPAILARAEWIRANGYGWIRQNQDPQPRAQKNPPRQSLSG